MRMVSGLRSQEFLRYASTNLPLKCITEGMRNFGMYPTCCPSALEFILTSALRVQVVYHLKTTSRGRTPTPNSTIILKKKINIYSAKHFFRVA